jgi:hypothetical protein
LWSYENGQLRSGQILKLSTIAVYAQSTVHFAQFLSVNPHYLRGVVRQDEIRECELVEENCSKAFTRKLACDDVVRRDNQLGYYCSPSVFGRFLSSKTVEDR